MTETQTEMLKIMTRLGIARVPADRYRYKHWHYTNLADAIAQAERDLRK